MALLITVPITLPVMGLVYLGGTLHDLIKAHQIEQCCKKLKDLMALPDYAIQHAKYCNEPCVWLKWWTMGKDTETKTCVAIVDIECIHNRNVIRQMIGDIESTTNTSFLLVYANLCKFEDGATLHRIIRSHVANIKPGEFVMLHHTNARRPKTI